MGADDEFGNYRAFGTPRSRWGDYGAAAVDGRDFWIASQYVARSCTLAQFANPAALLTCNGTRVALTNWGTRVSHIEP